MLIKKPNDIRSSEITPERVYVDRRKFIGLAAAGVAGAGLAALPQSARGVAPVGQRGSQAQKDWSLVRSDLNEELTPYEDVTEYNNFYEFSTSKDGPAKRSKDFVPRPWTIEVEGMCQNPGTYGLEDFIKGSTLEDRVYRLRCVEAWSMVVPWRGFALRDVIARAEPLGSARFVEFTTLLDPERMPGQRRPVLRWPYVEALRLDEARHPLAILATGVYGEDLPNQNGAPLRLVVPWKYGFKSIKSIVKMRFLEKMPITSWAESNPSEYGFYANVNPEVDHPRWSQARERRLGEFRRRATLPFNGYADSVAALYDGLDLRVNY